MHALFQAIMILNPLQLFFFFTNPACHSPIIFFSKTGDLSQFLCKKFLKYISLFLIFCTSTHCCHDSYNSTPQHFLEWFVLFIISTQQQHCFIFRKKTRRPTHKPPSQKTNELTCYCLENFSLMSHRLSILMMPDTPTAYNYHVPY